MRVSCSWLFMLVACSHKPVKDPSGAPPKPQAAGARALSPMAAAAAEAAASQGAAPPRVARRPGAPMKAKISSADSPAAMEERGDAPGGAAAASAPAPPPPPQVAWECFERSIFSSGEANERFTRQRLVGDTLEVDTVLGDEHKTIARLHFAHTDDGLRTSWRGFPVQATLDASDATDVSITLTLKNGNQVREHRTIEGDVLTLTGVDVELRMQRRDCDEIGHVFAESEAIFFSVDHPEAPTDE